MEISGLFFQRCMIVTNSNEIISGKPNGADVHEVSFKLYITRITITMGGIYCCTKSRILRQIYSAEPIKTIKKGAESFIRSLN